MEEKLNKEKEKKYKNKISKDKNKINSFDNSFIDNFSLNEFYEIDPSSNDKNNLSKTSHDLFNSSIKDSNRELNSIEFYLNSISKYSLISEDEVIELSKRIQENGDKEALHKLVESNLRLAFKIAKTYSNLTKTPLEELIQVANKGLLYSAYNFKESKNIKFSTFASLNIKSEILKFINVDNKKLTISTREFNKINDINRFIKKFAEENGTEPSNERILKEFKNKYTLKQIENVRNTNFIFLNLDENFEDGTSQNDLISDPSEESLIDSVNRKDLLDFIYKEVDCLSDREKMVVLDYCNGITFVEISQKINLTKQRVQQIFNEAIEKIKENIGKMD